ncbi:MarR family winged helix-turn-helix transcriptional regulator [Microlunatus parietis]|uniref:DNA-binding MarR family transcriptional regulator n=1 Tax=Microlunatus parietis TaxID=682979 RepID=A0A7Y9LBL2_9ACTN|nr:MarR family winged helix-turn-helix transcriptional regulator [Microlunatus parietis]NYE71852.1 DNA-binding MarR family transcriptional regulator [Microlunatus parietis]
MTDLPDTLGFHLMRLGRAAGDRYADRLARLGLRPLHVRLLTAIRVAERAPQNEYAADLGMTSGSVVRLADDLERLGAIVRERDTDDRRRQFLVLTPIGEALLRNAVQAAIELDKELTRDLSAPAHARLARTLKRIGATLT